jgi:poly(hydroxyalkanoate) granule associated protein phasin
MAKKATSIPAVVRTAINRLQRDGGQLVGRVERDLARFTRRTRAELTKEATVLRRELKSLASKASHKLDGSPRDLISAVEKRVGAVEADIRRRLDVARTADVTTLGGRLEAIERRLGEMEQRIVELADQLHDRVDTGAA